MKTTKEREKLIRDIFIVALYTGCRIKEILFLKNANIHIDEGYFINCLARIHSPLKVM